MALIFLKNWISGNVTLWQTIYIHDRSNIACELYRQRAFDEIATRCESSFTVLLFMPLQCNVAVASRQQSFICLCKVPFPSSPTRSWRKKYNEISFLLIQQLSVQPTKWRTDELSIKLVRATKFRSSRKVWGMFGSRVLAWRQVQYISIVPSIPRSPPKCLKNEHDIHTLNKDPIYLNGNCWRLRTLLKASWQRHEFSIALKHILKSTL